MARDSITWRVLSNHLTGEIQGQIRRQSYEAVRTTMDIVLTDVRRRMHVPGTGRIYVRGGIVHQASAPGQAPAAETGGLIMSYEVGVGYDPDGDPVGIIHSDHEAAAALEYGAPGRNLAARPALTPALQAARDPFKHDASSRLRRLGL